MRYRAILLGCVGAIIAVSVVSVATAADVGITWNLPYSSANIANISANVNYQGVFNESDSTTAHVWGSIPATLTSTFNASTHAATITGLAFSYNKPGTLQFDNVTMTFGSYDSWFLPTGAQVKTNGLKATLYTNSGTVGPVNSDGTFGNSYHNVEINSGTAVSDGKAGGVTIGALAQTFDLGANPASSTGTGTAGPISVALSGSGYNISSSISSGYSVTYNYTASLQVPIDVTKPIENGGSNYGTMHVTANLVTDTTTFSHTFSYLTGDCNLDGTVGFDDLTTVVAHYQQNYSGWANGDFNGDGSVDFEDLTAEVARYMQSGGSEAAASQMLLGTGVAVPEPSSFVLMSVLGVLLASGAAYRSRRS
jgi:hypothetical protein